MFDAIDGERETWLNLCARVFERLREGVMITDGEARLLYVNAAFTAITGYSAAEVLGRNPRFLNSGRQTKAFYEALWNALASKG